MMTTTGYGNKKPGDVISVKKLQHKLNLNPTCCDTNMSFTLNVKPENTVLTHTVIIIIQTILPVMFCYYTLFSLTYVYSLSLFL